MLVRDAPELEVFMLRRNLRSAFVAGAYLFPGGAVDDDDSARELVTRVHGLDSVTADAWLGLGSNALRFWVAAIRESFEEAGVLLARHDTTGAPVDVTELGVARLESDRRALIAGERRFVDIVGGRGLVLDAGALFALARWVTPLGAPRRYDTWTFVAAAPDGHAYVHDDDETIASVWVRPADALEQARQKEIELIYPTFRSLQVLADYERAADLLTGLRTAWVQPERPPQMVEPGQGWMVDLGAHGHHADHHADAVANATIMGRRAEAH